MKNLSLKTILLLILIIVIFVSSVVVYNNNNTYITLNKHKHVGEIYSELQNNDETVKYTDTVSFREMLSGGDYYFGETIRIGDVFITAKNCGYVEGLTDNEYITMDGEKLKHDEKYALLFIEIVNNSSKEIVFNNESFILSYNYNNTIRKTELPNNSYWGKIENSFSLTTLSGFTRRSGYIYFPINETKLKDFNLKVDVGNVPVIFTK